MNSEPGSHELIARVLECARTAGATATDAVLVENESMETRIRGDEVDRVTQARERCLGIRALSGGNGAGLRTAITSTSDLSIEAVEKLVAETVDLARQTAPDPAAGLPEEDPATEVPDLGLLDPADRNVAVEARIEDARRAERDARESDVRIDNSEGSEAGSHFAKVHYGNSVGFSGSYESAFHSLYSQPIARENGSMQRDSWFTIGRRLADLEDAAEVGRRAAQRALGRLGARRVPTCEVPVIFDAVTAASLVGQLASCLSGYSVYRKMTFLESRMGDAVAPEFVTIVDDGRLQGGLGSKPFDGEGLATRRNILVDRGRLSSWLLDSYSGRKLDLPSTGNAARSAGSAPGVSATNLWIEPGEARLEELIQDTPRGLLVTELIGMGFNPVTGDYSRGAAGFWIEAGEIAYPVEEITVAGNLGDMLMNIDAVGSELLWRSRIAAPPLRIARMTVAGE